MNNRTEQPAVQTEQPAQTRVTTIRGIDDLIVRQALRTPHAPAVRSPHLTLSYHHLLLRSSRLARLLLALGAGPDVRIALCLPRTPDLIVSLLAILRSGSPYVPLDPRYPSPRLSFLLHDSHAHLLLTTSALLPTLPPLPPTLSVLCLDSLPDLDTLPDLDPSSLPPRHLDSLAYLIYTSGSTGLPKGVALSHRNALSLLSWAHHSLGPAPLAGVLASTSLCFDLSVFELFAPLSLGGQVFLVEHLLDLLHFPPAWKDLHALTLVNTVPSLLLDFLRLGSLPPSVTTVSLAGEPLPPALLHLVYQQPAVHTVYNLYGPSEDTTYSTWIRLPRPTAASTAPIPIGRPLPGTHAYVLDPTGLPVPTGSPGELYLAGTGLARGYLDRPDLTAARFLPAPTGCLPPGARLYRTGDLVRWHDDVLLYLGRTDSQVKLRGFRIELGEVEALLQGLPGVRQAIATLADRRPGDPRLLAYVLAQPGTALDGRALRAALRELAPDHLIPARILVLPHLPLTPNGKVDRQALPAPTWELDGPEESEAEDAPGNAREQELARIWGEVLGLRRVRRQQRFFELGGHSLLALQVLARIRQRYGCELPLRLLFANPTLAEMAACVADERAQPLPTALAPVSRAEPVPLSLLQEGLWFLHHLTSDNAIWNVPTTIHLRGPVQPTALEESLNSVIQRHEALRTTFMIVNDRPVQVVAPTLRLTLPVVELADNEIAVDKREQLEQAWIATQTHHPFDLRQGPLLRATLCRLDNSEYLLLLVVHHILFDGWSRDILAHELLETYSARVEGREARLPTLAVQYADYASWQRERLRGQAREEPLAYWAAMLKDAPQSTSFPADHPRPALQSHRGARLTQSLSAELAGGIKTLSAHAGVTPYTTLLAAFAVLLSRSGGQEDLVIGVPLASRHFTELEPLIGHFVNTLPLRLRLRGEQSFQELLQQVQTRLLEALARQEFPFELIVKALSPARNLSSTPLFQVTCTLQSATISAQPAGLTAVVDEPESGLTAFDLSLELRESAQDLSLRCVYCRDLFTQASIAGLLRRLQTILACALADPTQAVGQLAVASLQERQQLTKWNATRRPYALHISVPQLCEARAERTPHAPALLCAEQQLSYGELNERANQLAHYLRTQGVGPESCVGILAARSIELVIAQLAVLKADGAYVPLDPTYPATRLAFLLRDARVSMLLTQTELLPQLASLPLAGVQVFYLDAPCVQVRQQPCSNPPHRLTPENLAYVIYTSGSTGQPKGVQITHRSLSNLVFWHQQAFAISAQDRATLIAAPAFDASVWECWPYLAQGAVLCIPDEMTRLEPAALQRWLLKERISVSFLPTPLAESLLRLPWPAHSSLRLLLTGGDTLRAVPQALPFTLVNNYGPTEQTVVATSGQVTPGEEGLPAIGRPIANTRVSVLDQALNPVPIGVAGELYISGEGLARGYLGRAELTAERFLPHPCSTQAGARCYRTGDLVRYRPDGSLTFLGRVDDQVKVRGVRIELREIEAVVQRSPLVREALVVLREDPPLQRRLVCYLVPALHVSEEQLPLANALRKYCREHLPEAMVPCAFVILAAIPLTPNGKRDRRALPAPADEGRGMAQSPAPTGFLEQQLATVWQSVLGVAHVLVNDNFFDLGGHSLLAAQLIARTNEAFQIELPLQAIFEAPTLQTMADLVESALITALETPGAGHND
ncbi:MAG TPA: amino acid adenylation domain-containing protein [Ktedonobacteraceae bacterium]